MNKVELVGRLTKEATMNYSGKGKDALAIAKFTLAVPRQGKSDTADFISCTAFGKLAEVIDEYCSKGSRIAVWGNLQTGSYENKEGNTVYTTDVILEGMEFCDTKRNDEDEPKKGRK